MPDGFLKPEEVLGVWDIRPGDKVADFGCGAGFFSIPLGQKVGPQGKVYALDIRPEALEATRAKIKLFHIFNVEPQRADLELPQGSTLRDESIDKVLIANILFQAEDKNAVAKEAYRILKKGGSAMIVEWEDSASGGIPPLEHRISRDEAKQILQGAGFQFFKEFAAGSHHYGLIFNKQ